MNIHGRIKNRIPGGDFYERWKFSRTFRGVEGYEWIYQCHRNKYFFGGERFEKQQILWMEDNFLKNGCLDFGWLKIKKDDILKGVANELFDLVIPYVDENYDSQIASILNEGPYEMFGVKVEEGDVVIDAGANVGIFTIFAAKYRKAYVHAFEPIESVAAMMRENLILNQAEGVIVNVMGLSDRPKTAVAVRKKDGITDATVKTERKPKKNRIEQRIVLTAIDDYVKEKHLSKVDFIKADIEGSERDMLRGAVRTMRNFKPKIACCIYHFADDREVLTDIILKANPDYKIQYTAKKLFAT